MSTLPLRPTTIQQCAAAIAEAHAAGGQVRLLGSGSMPSFPGQCPDDARQISLVRMNKLLEHAVADMTVIVQAGITLEALQRELAWRNQWFPVDPPILGPGGDAGPLQARGPGSRTLGGAIASNTLGPLRFGFGDYRQLILGMTWIDAHGRVLRGGGRTVKNVAGYSTPRMMIGSAGMLGVIAEVTLRTFARPADERCVVFYAGSAAQAEELLAALLLAPVSPAYLQVIGQKSFQGNPLQLPAGDPGGMIVVAGFLGRVDVCAAQVDIIRALPQAAALETISQTAAQSGRLRLWMCTEPGGPEAAFRLHLKSSQVCPFVAAIEARGGWAVAEAGAGIIRGTLPPAAVGEFALAADRASGMLVWTRGGLGLRPATELARRLKREIDPNGLFC